MDTILLFIRRCSLIDVNLLQIKTRTSTLLVNLDVLTKAFRIDYILTFKNTKTFKNNSCRNYINLRVNNTK